MLKLLHAGFPRLVRSKFFLASLIGMFVMGLFTVLGYYLTMGSVAGIDPIPYTTDLYIFLFIVPFLLSALCPLFVGTEFGDGTIRNKLVVGATRPRLYLSNLTIVFASSLALSLAYLVPYLALALPLLGPAEYAIPTVLRYAGLSLLNLLCFSSLFTLLAMNIRSRSVGIAASILAMLALFFVALWLMQVITTPETIQVMEGADPSAGYSEVEFVERPNPNYLRPGPLRTILEALTLILPSGQMFLLPTYYAAKPLEALWFGLGFWIATMGIGLYLFLKKDLK